MDFDLAKLDYQTRYKLVSGVVVPRPIAWVNTLNPDGTCNTAPYSFFNLVAAHTLIMSISDRPDGTPKDTLANLRRHPEFVVHLPDEATIEAAVFTCCDFPPGIQEAVEAGLTLVPSAAVKVPRIAEAPVALEGRLLKEVDLDPADHRLVVGRLLHLHVRDDILMENNRIDWRRYRPIGRLAGEGYCYVRELFGLRRPTYARYLEDPEGEHDLRRDLFPS